MYNQPPPTLPPIATIENGIEYNEGIAHIKQEKDILPPLLAKNDNDSNNNNNSRISINQLCNGPDEEMKKAAAVLETMKQTTLPPIEVTQTNNTSHEGSVVSPNSDGFISRLGELLFVRKTMDAYEHGKSTSPFIKYTTEMVESSVSRISKPVIEKIPQLAHLDQYACRGLDKLEEIMDTTSSSNSNNSSNPNNNNVDGGDSSYGHYNGGGDTESESRKRKVRGESPLYRNPQSWTHRTPQSNGSYVYHNTTTSSSTPTSTSRWQRVLVGAGAAVGTARAVVSEEAMKSLRYCLQWLQYTTQHIKHQIAMLHDLIASLTTPSSNPRIHSDAQAQSTLTMIKKDIVDNLRKVIDVVSKYASKCLPDHSKQNVRSFIMSLPTRWATINHSDLSASASPLSSPRLAPINAHQNSQTADYAHRLLSLATESLDMLGRVASIFGETVECAEAWVERLRSVGVGSGSSATESIQFDSADWSSQQSGCTYSQSHPRSRRSSNSSRMVNRKYTRVEDDEESVNNNYDSDNSEDSDSMVENMRMEDNRSHRSLKNPNSIKSLQHSGLNGGKKRKKLAKKDNKMDLS